jgi:nucleoside-diphosphate-sugar epimerase
MSGAVLGPTAVVTGASGYLGGCVSAALGRHGWRVRALNRRADPPGSDTRRFQLGEAVSPDALQGAAALVHCAWDFDPRTWREIVEVNVRGSEALFHVASRARVERVVFVSTLSAFDGCRSLYGRAKLEVERVALAHGALVVRPGLIYGARPGGMFGRLVGAIGRSSVVPLVGGGRQIFYLVHERDLCDFVAAHCDGTVPRLDRAVSAAHERGWPFRTILEEIGRAQGRRLTFVPIPWRPAWAVLRLGEALGLTLAFRSDSLVSLMEESPAPSFEANRRLGLACRPFALDGIELGTATS